MNKFYTCMCIDIIDKEYKTKKTISNQILQDQLEDIFSFCRIHLYIASADLHQWQLHGIHNVHKSVTRYATLLARVPAQRQSN